jgi:hypothetical protein
MFRLAKTVWSKGHVHMEAYTLSCACLYRRLKEQTLLGEILYRHAKFIPHVHWTLLQKRHGLRVTEKYHMVTVGFWSHPYISLLVNCIIKWETKHHSIFVVYEPDINRDNLCYHAVRVVTYTKTFEFTDIIWFCKPVIILPFTGSGLFHSMMLHKTVHAVSNAVFTSLM